MDDSFFIKELKKTRLTANTALALAFALAVFVAIQFRQIGRLAAMIAEDRQVIYGRSGGTPGSLVEP